jgi:predicted PurR-regulated permease PerM
MAPVTQSDNNQARRWILFCAAGLLLVLLVVLLRPILTPFVVGALLAYLGDPLVDRLERLGCPRSAAAALVFLLLTLLVILGLVITVPMLAHQLDELVRRLPALYQWFASEAVPWLQQRFNLPEQALPRLGVGRTLAENWQSVGKVLANLGRYITGSGINFLVSLGNLVLVPVVAFYLLRDWDKLTPRLLALLPMAWQPRAQVLARESDEVIGAFLRGQFLVMLGLTIIYVGGLSLVGLELAFLIGTVAGLASIVPYLGAVVGIVAASVAALLQFHDWSALLWVGLVFMIGQLIEGYLLTPNLVGDRIGLHPVAVIFAVLAGGQLAGFVGILIALPMAAVIVVFMNHIHDYYKDSALYGDREQDRDS